MKICDGLNNILMENENLKNTYFFIDVSKVPVRLIALALLIRMSMPP